MSTILSSAVVLESQTPPTVGNLSVQTSSLRQQLAPGRHLVVSPYQDEEHLLDLETVGVEQQLMAIALTKLKCLRDDYATSPYLETFNWEEVIDTLRELARESNHVWKETSFYVVAFKSRIPPTTIYKELGALDKAAHAKATASGGFLK